MKKRSLLAALVPLALIAAGCGGDDSDSDNDTTTTMGEGSDTTTGGGAGDQLENTGKVVLLSAGEPEETDAYQTIFDDLINAETDYEVEVVAAGDFEQQFQIQAQGGTLEVAAVPQPGAIADLADQGLIVSLEDMGVDVAALSELLGESFVELGEHNGEHYGVPTNINLKSMVWYPKAAFDEAGYEVPATWDELIALSDQIVADGSSPWCVGFMSEGSTGWPATDWLEDIVLRTAGPDVYDQWVAHEVPFSDPQIKHAAELFGQIMFTEGYVLGGASNTPDIAFGDAPMPMFDSPPKCWLHRQASFINASFPESAEAGVDYDWFPFPPIDQEGTLFAGELTVIGTAGNRPEVVDFLNRFIAENVQCAMGGVQASSRISPNVNVGEDCYSNEILAGASTVLTEALQAGTGRFDASDLMPAAVGSGSEWTEMINYIRNGPDYLDTAMENIDASWPS